MSAKVFANQKEQSSHQQPQPALKEDPKPQPQPAGESNLPLHGFAEPETKEVDMLPGEPWALVEVQGTSVPLASEVPGFRVDPFKKTPSVKCPHYSPASQCPGRYDFEPVTQILTHPLQANFRVSASKESFAFALRPLHRLSWSALVSWLLGLQRTSMQF